MYKDWIDKNLLCPSKEGAKVRRFYKFVTGDWLIANHPEVYQWVIDATPLVNGDIKEKMRSILDEMVSKGCGICHSPVGYIPSTKEFRKYCSTQCQKVGAKEVRIATTLERYGVENAGGLAEFTEKAKETNRDKYGVDNYNQLTERRELLSRTTTFRNEDTKSKIRSTLEEKYGGHHLRTEDSLEKLKRTNKDRYGVSYQMQREEMKELIKASNLEKYGVESFTQTEDFRIKSKNTFMEKYGVPHHSMRENYREIHKEYYSDYHKKEHLTEYGKKISNDDEFFKSEFDLKTIEEIMDQSGYSRSSILRRSSSLGIRSPSISTGENDLLSYVQSLGFDAHRSRSIIPPLEIDIWIPEANIGIEYCGHYWHGEKVQSDKNYHRTKHKLMEDKGCRLITIFEGEWALRQEQVKSLIRNALGVDKRNVFARKTKIFYPTTEEEKLFYEDYHIQGWVGSTYCVGLKYNDEIVAMMSFTLRGKYWELVRFSSSIRVTGGASKLLKHFQKTHEWDEIVSFADLRTSQGKLYNRLGFLVDKEIRPDYVYARSNSMILDHKFKHRKNKYADRYDISTMTEREIMIAEGYWRIWDCGKIRYVMRNGG